MRKIPIPLLIIILAFNVAACTPGQGAPTVEPVSSEAVLADSFFFGEAFVDANQNGVIDAQDTPLQGALFTAEDAAGANAGGRTEVDGRAMAWWPGKTKYPVTLEMRPPEESPYILASPSPVILAEGSMAQFLFLEEGAALQTPQHPDEEAGPAPLREKTQYTLSATLDYDRHHLVVEEEIDYLNRTSEAIPDHLMLMVEPAFYTGVFTLISLDWADGTPVQGSTWEGTQLRIPLSASLEPGERIRLSIAYELNIPAPQPSADIRPIPFGYSARQTNLVDWYPFVPPYVPGSGWLAHSQGYFGEHLAYEIADFDVRIRFAGGRSDLVIAASALAEEEVDWRRYRLESARNFVWSVSPDYQVLSEVVGPVTVLSYAFPYHAQGNQAVLEATVASLQLYNQLFGPYPREVLTAVEADFLDGMEYDGLYFLSGGFYNLYQGTQAEYLIAIAAHETAHQWWYAMVGNDQALEPWLDEALCTYSERLYYEHLYPDGLPWWWAYRVEYYDPKGWVDGPIYNPEGYRAYRDAVYLNGAVFLEDLRSLIGDESFFAFLKDYANRNAGALATAEDFFSILRQHTQADLAPLLEQYFQDQ